MTKDWQHKKPSDPDTKWEDCTKKEAVIWKKKGQEIREKPAATSPTNNCSDVDKKYVDQGYVMTLDVDRYRKAKNKGTYEVDFKFCVSDNKNHYYYKPEVNTGTVPPPNQTPSTGYSNCKNGPYKKGCKGSSIATVQQCLIEKGYVLKYGPDGKFGKYTEEALLNATDKKEFTKDEITTLCQKMKPEESLSAAFGKEEQKSYWQDLKDKGLIYSKGIIYLLKNGVTYVYIIKRTKDSTKVPITSETELKDKTKLIQSFDEFDYEVLYPINPADKSTAGEVGVLTAALNQNDEVFVKIVKDNQGNWKPAESEESFELSGEEPMTESVIKSILKLRLFEQNVTRTIGSSSSPSKSSSVGGGTSGSVSASLTSSSAPKVQKTEKDKQNEVKTVMDPKRIELLSTIDKLIQYTEKNGGFTKGEKIKEFKKNRDLIGNMNSSDVCSEESQKSLKSAIKDLDKSMSDYDKFLDNNEETYLKKIRSILVSIPSECGKINEKYKTTTPSTLTPSTSSLTSTPSSQSNNASAIDKGNESLNTKTKEDVTTKKVESGVGVDPEVKSFLESNGYTFDKPGIEEKERLSTKTTVGQQLRNLDGDGIYAEYYSDETPIWKSTDPLNKDVVSDEGFKQLIKNINSEIPVESKRPFCRSSIKLLYQSAFPSTRVVQLKKRSVIENDVRLNQLKSAIIRCDEEKNFFEGAGGMRDELTALYRCRSNKKGKSYYGVDRYCLTDYKKLKQDNPTMQRESVVKRHIAEAIKNKQKDVMVESILRDIKGLKK
jgi:hypothetical protein